MEESLTTLVASGELATAPPCTTRTSSRRWARRPGNASILPLVYPCTASARLVFLSATNSLDAGLLLLRSSKLPLEFFFLVTQRRFSHTLFTPSPQSVPSTLPYPPVPLTHVQFPSCSPCSSVSTGSQLLSWARTETT